jgi:transcriptional regulator GlxA family with amidase domain
MRLGIPVYDKVDLLDVTGPAEMFYWAGRSQPLETLIISQDGCPVTAMSGIRFDAHASFDEVPTLDVLWVPGGDPDMLGQIMSDPGSPYLAYLRQVAEKATWICSVCEGALLLAQAGLLDGHKATTHWAFIACLQTFCEIDVDTTNPRFVVSGDRLTGGGISSGLDEALQLIMMLFGQAAAETVQVTTQYFPNPPVMGTIPPTPTCPVTWS